MSTEANTRVDDAGLFETLSGGREVTLPLGSGVSHWGESSLPTGMALSWEVSQAVVALDDATLTDTTALWHSFKAFTFEQWIQQCIGSERMGNPLRARYAGGRVAAPEMMATFPTPSYWQCDTTQEYSVATHLAGHRESAAC